MVRIDRTSEDKIARTRPPRALQRGRDARGTVSTAAGVLLHRVCRASVSLMLGDDAGRRVGDGRCIRTAGRGSISNMRWLAVLLVVISACSSRTNTSAASPTVGGGSPATPAPSSPVTAASSATPAPSPPVNDPPEPVSPQIECQITRKVSCHDGAATRTAFQHSPFERCATTQPPAQPNSPVPDARAQFSAAETRAARTGAPQTCCYVDFIVGACL